jgi:PAS domain S-box-containing protein
LTTAGTDPALSGSAAFPAGDGEMARLIRRFDWSATALGPLSGWPQSLRSAVAMMQDSLIPMVMMWGEDGVLIYNDPYAEFAAQRHPGILGMKVREAWPEIADWNSEVMKVGLAGKTLAYGDQQLILHRNGVAEPVWMDLSYGPVRDDAGKPSGTLCIVTETTSRVTAERALAIERAAVLEANLRLSMESSFLRELFEQAPSFMALLTGPDHVFTLANHTYLQTVGRRNIVGLPLDEALPEIRGQGFVDVLNSVRASGEPFIASGAKVVLHREEGSRPEERYLDFIYQPIRNRDGDVTGIFVEGQDVTERLRGEQQLRLVVNELNHRVKNTLATIQSIASQTFRNADDLAQAQANFSARIIALAKANDLLTEENWEGASLATIISRAAAVHAGDAKRFVISGPMVRLSPKTAMSLSMAMHELATNALKYGALSNETGVVTVSWSVAGDRLHLEWRETGGPPVSKPDRRGFGSRLIERGLAAEMSGDVAMMFEPGGLVCVIDAQLDRDARAGA